MSDTATNSVFGTLWSAFSGANTVVSGSESDISGAVAWKVDNANNSRTLKYSSEDSHEYSSLVYSPTTMSYTIPIITISGSSVSDSANTSTSQPQSTYQTPTLTTTQSANQEDTGGTSSIVDTIIPVAVIGGIGLLGYAAIKAFAGGK